MLIFNAKIMLFFFVFFPIVKTDRPVPPGRIGKMLFLEHITDDMRQASRDKLISVTQGHLKDVAERFILLSFWGFSSSGGGGWGDNLKKSN